MAMLNNQMVPFLPTAQEPRPFSSSLGRPALRGAAAAPRAGAAELCRAELQRAAAGVAGGAAAVGRFWPWDLRSFGEKHGKHMGFEKFHGKYDGIIWSNPMAKL